MQTPILIKSPLNYRNGSPDILTTLYLKDAAAQKLNRPGTYTKDNISNDISLATVSASYHDTIKKSSSLANTEFRVDSQTIYSWKELKLKKNYENFVMSDQQAAAAAAAAKHQSKPSAAAAAPHQLPRIISKPLLLPPKVTRVPVPVTPRSSLSSGGKSDTRKDQAYKTLEVYLRKKEIKEKYSNLMTATHENSARPESTARPNSKALSSRSNLTNSSSTKNTSDKRQSKTMLKEISEGKKALNRLPPHHIEDFIEYSTRKINKMNVVKSPSRVSTRWSMDTSQKLYMVGAPSMRHNKCESPSISKSTSTSTFSGKTAVDRQEISVQTDFIPSEKNSSFDYSLYKSQSHIDLKISNKFLRNYPKIILANNEPGRSLLIMDSPRPSDPINKFDNTTRTSSMESFNSAHGDFISFDYLNPAKKRSNVSSKKQGSSSNSSPAGDSPDLSVGEFNLDSLIGVGSADRVKVLLLKLSKLLRVNENGDDTSIPIVFPLEAMNADGVAIDKDSSSVLSEISDDLEEPTNLMSSAAEIIVTSSKNESVHNLCQPTQVSVNTSISRQTNNEGGGNFGGTCEIEWDIENTNSEASVLIKSIQNSVDCRSSKSIVGGEGDQGQQLQQQQQTHEQTNKINIKLSHQHFHTFNQLQREQYQWGKRKNLKRVHFKQSIMILSYVILFLLMFGALSLPKFQCLSN